MMKSPNSMLSTSCRMVATKMMTKKNLTHCGKNIILPHQFLNQFDQNPLHVLQIVGLVFLSNLFLRMNCCVSTSCGCCIFSILPVASLLWFFCSHLADPVVHFHPQRLRRVPTNFRVCFVLLSSQRKSGLLLRSCRMLCKCSHPIQCWSMSLDEEDRSGICPGVCVSFSVPFWACCELHETDSSWSQNWWLTRRHIFLCSTVDFFPKAAGICRTYNIQCPFLNRVLALYFRNDLAHFEVLRVSHAVDQFLRLLAEQIEFLILVLLSNHQITPTCCILVNFPSILLYTAILGFFRSYLTSWCWSTHIWVSWWISHVSLSWHFSHPESTQKSFSEVLSLIYEQLLASLSPCAHPLRCTHPTLKHLKCSNALTARTAPISFLKILVCFMQNNTTSRVRAQELTCFDWTAWVERLARAPATASCRAWISVSVPGTDSLEWLVQPKRIIVVMSSSNKGKTKEVRLACSKVAWSSVKRHVVTGSDAFFLSCCSAFPMLWINSFHFFLAEQIKFLVCVQVCHQRVAIFVWLKLTLQLRVSSSCQFHRSLHSISYDERRMFSLGDWRNSDVHDARSAWVQLFAVTLDWNTLLQKKNSWFHVFHSLDAYRKKSFLKNKCVDRVWENCKNLWATVKVKKCTQLCGMSWGNSNHARLLLSTHIVLATVKHTVGHLGDWYILFVQFFTWLHVHNHLDAYRRQKKGWLCWFVFDRIAIPSEEL